MSRLAALASVLLVVSAGVVGSAQGRGGGPAPTPRASAPLDLTGYWVSVITEDWRWRMVTPPKGDYVSVPLNAEGTRRADTWDPAMDGRCEAYGAAALLRMPTRLRITWDSDTVLKIESDAGTQTRRLVFGESPASPAHTLQGVSVANWERPAPAGRGGPPLGQGGGPGGGAPAAGPPPPGGSLRVLTSMLSGGWLRRNGVPYSENAELTEYFDRVAGPDGTEWFTVISIVRDSTYLTQDYVTSSHFKREPDASKWRPTTCRTN